MLMLLGKFNCCEWPNFVQINQPSGHTGHKPGQALHKPKMKCVERE